MIRWIAAALLVIVAALGFVAWKRYAAFGRSKADHA